MATIKKGYKTIIIVGIICLIVGLLIGFASGSYITLKAVVKVASGFINIDMEKVNAAIYQYENNIGACFPSNFTI